MLAIRFHVNIPLEYEYVRVSVFCQGFNFWILFSTEKYDANSLKKVQTL